MTLKSTLIFAAILIGIFAAITTATYLYIDGKDKKITELQKEIETLKTNQTTLIGANKSLDGELERLRSESIQNREQLDKNMKLITDGQTRISDMEKALSDDKPGTTETDVKRTNDRQACLADMKLSVEQLDKCLIRTMNDNG